VFWDLIYELAADRGMTVLVTTHYMDEAEQCDRLAFILDGALIAESAPRDLKQDLRGRILEVRPDGDPFDVLARLRDDPAIEDAYLFGVTVRSVARAGDSSRLREILAPFGAPEAAEPSLEDVFVSLVRKRAREKELVTA
jgi:ABC-2 type transport system ATP-binding protein